MKLHCDACGSKDFELTDNDLLVRNVEIDGEPAKMFYFECPFCDKEFPYLYQTAEIAKLLEAVKVQEKEARELISRAEKSRLRKHQVAGDKAYRKLANKRRVLQEAHAKLKAKVEEALRNDTD